MKVTRLGVAAAAAGSALLLVTTVTTANAQPTVPNNAAPAVQQTVSAAVNYSGEDLFQALFFGTGPVAERYPNLVRVTSKAPEQEVKNAAANTLVKITSADPAFFPWFKSGITSGNRVTIATTLERVSDRLFALFGRPGSVGADPGRNSSLAAIRISAFIFALNTNAFIVRANAIDFFVEIGSNIADKQRRIVRDKWVNDIATTLR